MKTNFDVLLEHFPSACNAKPLKLCAKTLGIVKECPFEFINEYLGIYKACEKCWESEYNNDL